jgi:hypothetical protein
MNALGWDLSHSKRFEADCEAYLCQLEAQFAKGPSDAEVEKLTQELEHFGEFLTAINRLRQGETDPISLPRLRRPDGTSISQYYVLRVGPWYGYYFLDSAAMIGEGVFVFNEKSHDLEARVNQAVEEALNELKK